MVRSFSPALYHLGAGVKYLATAKRQHASDLLTARQLAASLQLPPGLEVTWIGTAGFRFSYQGVTIWLDPYVTRLSFGSLVLRRVIPPDERAIAAIIDHADAVLVGHTHFDHAMDVPAIAKRFGCPVYGSNSLVNLMGLHGIAQQAVEIEPHRSYEVGPFRFHFVPSVHSKLQLGLGIPYSGELTCESVDALIPQAYCCGHVFGVCVEVAGVRFYHQGSADLLEDEIRDAGVDYFLCGISGRRFTPRYVERILARLKPGAVVPTHYDDFFRPLSSGRFSFNVNLTGFADEVHTASRDVAVCVIEPESRPAIEAGT